jgi:hypothetical protein
VSPEEQLLTSQAMGVPLADVERFYANATIWKNNRYQVTVHKLEPTTTSASDVPIVWLSIKRLDCQAIYDWRHLQRIKNMLVGPECEGVQLFPAESRLVDTSNQYHLYCVTDPTFRWPFGFNERLVMDNPGGKAKQRPFAPSSRKSSPTGESHAVH